MHSLVRLVAIPATGIVVGAMGMRLGQAQATPHAFIIAEVQVNDTAAYRPYLQQTTAIVTKYGGHYIVRAGKTVSFEGTPPAPRVAVIEFPSLVALERFESSPEYRKVAEIRHKAATSRIFGVEGITP